MIAMFIAKALLFAAMLLVEALLILAAIFGWRALLRGEGGDTETGMAITGLLGALVWGAICAAAFDKLFGGA